MEQTLDRHEAENLTVAQVMLGRPKTVPPDATVADLRRLFENPSVRTALIVDGDAFVGTVERGDVLDAARASGEVRHFSVVRPSLADIFRTVVQR